MTAVQDAARRDVIASYGVVGQPPEPDLEGLVQLAATVCGVSTAVINIIDDRFQHQIAAVGLAPSVCAREDSMCAVVFQDPGHVVVRDARQDPRFRDNPFVTGDIAAVRFYASSPLVTPEGVPIGTLCVFDEEVGDLAPEDSRALALLAHQVVDVLELRRLTRELGQSNAALERFAGQVSHDLRNPLMALAGFIELAVDSPEMVGAPQAARALARAESVADRMAAMIGDLYAYARIGGAQPRREDIDLSELVSGVVEDLEAALVTTEGRVDVHLECRLTGDRTLLRALMQNLIANAVKFTAASGVAPRVVVRSHRLTGGWRITVDDNGPGVPPDQRERVFELMERGAVDDVPGLGIGLSTCRRIVDAHGGRVGIDESETGGTSVWMVIPDAA
ncbi:GAF domain-containing sensor histidine kinase [Microbacterium sp. SSW1-59]|uniref:sensor histidine kinase n=1 Tax=Microbacterium xanthum TaxID=3079794 RepID=UPI002AD597FC|nr:GAF domain-containing sensor histidine kinase [Microbacterium sp. SSW1-59]MDZ8201668.1 GAF domain-containing sensor histidine kinase [Microbacterium sp. SSW1-59]